MFKEKAKDKKLPIYPKDVVNKGFLEGCYWDEDVEGFEFLMEIPRDVAMTFLDLLDYKKGVGFQNRFLNKNCLLLYLDTCADHCIWLHLHDFRWSLLKFSPTMEQIKDPDWSLINQIAWNGLKKLFPGRFC